MKQFKLFIFSLLLLFTLHFKANAFIYISGSSYNKGARPINHAPVWTSRKVTFYLNTDQAAYAGSINPDITSNQFITAVQNGINAWAAACNADFSVKLVGTTSSKKSTTDQQNTIVWDNRTTAEGNVFQDNAVLAAAFTTLSSDEFFDCDIVVNGEFSGTFGVNGESNKYDLVSTITHEMGHCLGLDHPIEPSTYTAGNSLLTQSTMVQAAVAGVGSTYRRNIKRDDSDGIECIYQHGRALRAGTNSCTSYHGTNGGSAITGSQTGGAHTLSLASCGNEADAITMMTNDTIGGGCIGSAFADNQSSIHETHYPHLSFWIEWSLFLIIFQLFFRKKVKKFFFSIWPILLFTLVESNAHANQILNNNRSPASDVISSKDIDHNVLFEIGLEYRKLNPLLLNDFAVMDTLYGLWESPPKEEKFTHEWDVVSKIGFPASFFGLFDISVGPFFRYITPTTVLQTSRTLSTAVNMGKKTTLSGFNVGPFFRGYFFEQTPFHLSLEYALGIGTVNLEQEITGTSISNFKASATSIEHDFTLGFLFDITQSMGLQASLGYSMSNTNYVTADNSTGPLYDSIKQNERVYVRHEGNYKELQIYRSGYLLGLAFVFKF